MIALSGQKTTRVVAIQDLLLVALSTAVIVLSQLQRGPARQVVELRSAEGNLQTYSLDVDDPRLAKIRSESKVRSTTDGPAADASLAMLRWQAEVAGFYAELTDPFVALDQAPTGPPPKDGLVISASFYKGASSAKGTPSDPEDQHSHWLKLRDESMAALAVAAARLEHQRSLSDLQGKPSVLFGPVVKGAYSLKSLSLAGGLALCVAMAMVYWTYACPDIRLASEDAAVSAGANPSESGQLRLAVPADWVRIHQPAPVIARKMVYATLVITALACIVT